MSRTLILMRHGKSGYPDGVADHRRPLAKRGIREAALAGRWMAEHGLAVDAVLCSTSTRTRQTLDRTGITAPTTFVSDIYGGDADDVLEAIRIYGAENASTILVVGHEPGMPLTALALDPNAQIPRFPTSAYAVLSIETTWAEIGLTPATGNQMIELAIPRE